MTRSRSGRLAGDRHGLTLEQRLRAVLRAAFAFTACVLAAVGCARAGIGRKVDVGGYRLRVQCAGQGSPTVIMDSGLGDPLDTWDEVWPGVKEFTRVCVYDRAGLGKSDAGPLPRTSQRIVDDLRAMLVIAQIPGPYLLVGHSFGGLNMRLFASEHADQVAGMVLVEATHEDYPEREKALRTNAEKRHFETTLGLARPAARSEYESLPKSAAQVRSAPPAAPDLPVVVITASRCCETEALKKVWMELQGDLVARYPRARQVIADSGHYVPYDQPSLIVDTLRDMVGSIRENNKKKSAGTSGRPAAGTASHR